MQPVVYTPPPVQQGTPTPVEIRELKLPENDYRFFQYSRLALPLLLLILGVFATLICLTAWQSRTDIRRMINGVPRTFQLNSQTTAFSESGVPKAKRNVRIAAFVIGIILSLAAIIVYFTDLPPVLRARINYPLGLVMILDAVLCWIVFALDVNSERQAIYCTSRPNETTVCQSREDLATGFSIFDAFHALFLLLSGALLLVYTYTGDWCRESETAENYETDIMYQPTYKPVLVRNGISRVRRTITMLALLLTVVFGVILMIFTILLHEYRGVTFLKDNFNRSYEDTKSGLPYTNSGWPMKCTKLRYAVCSFSIMTILFNLVPLTSRVVAYSLGFLYLLYSIMAFTVFGLDISAIEAAKKLVCPTGITCVYDSFNATIVFDFIGGILLLIYVIYEYYWSKRPQKIPATEIVTA
jgi:hypothetical protein